VNRALLVMVGGATGSLLRWAVGLRLGASTTGWPWATLVVNLTGSFVLGLLAAWPSFALETRPELRLLVVTGVLGGFTTYSSFNQETLAALLGGQPARALAFAAATLAGCLVSGAAGQLVGSRLG
jgi:CrcB protein